jgi:hypothetical protein
VNDKHKEYAGYAEHCLDKVDSRVSPNVDYLR